MREILFRAKRLDNGEWVESGSLLRTKNEETGEIIIFIGSAKPAVYIFNSEKDIVSVTSLDKCAYYRVDPSTVGQYTGLCDKNGVKIFEGDIVRRNACPMRITWDDFDGSFITECFIDDVRCVNTLAGHSMLEVIGDIHDNPELLEDGV